MQDPYPVLQTLISVDIAAVVRMFDTLSLLDEGAYCGSDDLAAQVRLLLTEYHRSKQVAAKCCFAG